MKKLILTVAVLFAATSLASSAFAAMKTLSPGTIYSVGSLTPATYKTSPKVTVRMQLEDGAVTAAEASAWGAVSGHQSALNKEKGIYYYTNNSDPGMWYLKAPTAAVSTFTPETSGEPTGGFIVEK